MYKEQIQTFKNYLEQYRYEENEYIYSMFIERQFKYVEIDYKDCISQQKINTYPIFSGLCLNKKTASICLFDVSTLFNILFPTNDMKNNFENLINIQSILCPSCGQTELSFNYLVYDPFFEKFNLFLDKLSLKEDVIPILKLEKIRKTNKIKYQLLYPELQQQDEQYNGEIIVEPKTHHFSLDQYSRMTSELDQEINELQQKKQNKQEQNQQDKLEEVQEKEIEEEINLKKAVQKIIIEEHNRKENQPSSYLSQEQPFRILKVSGKDGQNYLSIDNNKVYTFSKNQLYIAQANTLQFSKYFQVYDLYIQSNSNNNQLVSFSIEDQLYKNHTSILVYNEIILLGTYRGIYQIQLASLHDKNNIKKELLVQEIYKFEQEAQDDYELNEQYTPQMIFSHDNLYVLQYNPTLQNIQIKLIEDIFVYPEERIIPQPQIYLEISEKSQREKILLLNDDKNDQIIILTPDQYFVYHQIKQSWEEIDLQFNNNENNNGINKIKIKPKLNYYDYETNQEYNSHGKQLNYDDSDSDLDNDQEEQKKDYNNYDINNNSDDDENELSPQEMIERIFQDVKNIISLNLKERKYLICNIKDNYIYKINLNKFKIKSFECLINHNIISENCIFTQKTLYYTVSVKNNDGINDIEQDGDGDDDQNILQQQERQNSDLQELENQFNDYLDFLIKNDQNKSLPNIGNNNNNENNNKDYSVYCKNMALYSTSSLY